MRILLDLKPFVFTNIVSADSTAFTEELQEFLRLRNVPFSVGEIEARHGFLHGERSTCDVREIRSNADELRQVVGAAGFVF